MEAAQAWRTVITRSLPGTFILFSALAVHIVLGLFKLVRRESWRMPFWEAAQIGLGLAIPFLLLPHIVFTRLAHNLYGYEDRYFNSLNTIWPAVAWQQSALLLLVWLHGCIGMHFWLRLSPAYRAIAPYLMVAAVLVPALGLTGFTVAARDVKAVVAEDPDAARQPLFEMAGPLGEFMNPENRQFLSSLSNQAKNGTLFVWLGLAGVFGFRMFRRHYAGGKITIAYAAGRAVRTMPGPTLLEISRMHGVPHASVCGGRARCSTCRVHIEAGEKNLPPPGEAEAATLGRIGAEAGVRLACQVRPQANMRVTRQVKPDARRGSRHTAADPETQGIERTMAVLFLDIRNFTAFSEKRLPYDTVFLLNQLFAEVGEAIQQSGGWIDKYLGDGLMAIFGRNETPEVSSRQLLEAARRIDAALARFNAELKNAIGKPLRIGMGLHVGPLVLGRIGHLASAALTVIGQTVNVASRLEGLTKEHGVQIVTSLDVLAAADVDASAFAIETVTVRGSSEPIRVALIGSGADLPEEFGGRTEPPSAA
jgi:adenylate cyclase